MQTQTSVSVIEVLGPGCARCHETDRVVRQVVDEAKLECVVRKVVSVDRMVELGVLRTPALAFDGRVVHQGSIPKAEEVRRLLGLA
ncbi:MAG: MTH895/ArsE family thioredoxin-like protein [Vicinamibacteria bacterium]